MKKVSMTFGFLLTFIAPLLAVPLFIFGDEVEKALSVPSEYAGASFAVGLILAIGGAVLGSFLIFGSVLIPLFSSMSSNKKILTNGTAAEAKILAVNDTGTRINHDPLVNFTLEVKSSAQEPFQAQVSQTVSVINLPSYQPGQILNVKYIPGTNEVAIVGLKGA